ncbi:hypothetical protein OVA06_09695 [Pseudarthrobacter sp. SL88]|uniref:hypothetical protein n=1 Tax=Pseudarthrobacter sp. SL88 TaxID=2994666 RepID=UPI0022726F37|nr:hypothetical protein [Pseudarthrobacter sp. SL88]MCY1674979.1 hypothetical protein [Pseudarthrobacter sp. SL88]
MTRLLDVWGDTVDSRHLGASIGLGILVPVPIYLISESIFVGAVSNPALGKSYALLAGLLGCLLAGTVAARLFRPKRVLREQTEIDETAQRAALKEIIADSGALGDPAELAPAVQKELRALGLHDVFAAEHQRSQDHVSNAELALAKGSGA